MNGDILVYVYHLGRERFGAPVRLLREEYTKTGLATDEDIDHYVARARDPRVWSVYYATVSVMTRRV
jgi:hypothetical protein